MGLLCDSGLQLWVMSNGFDLLGKLSDVLCHIWLPVGTIILYRMWFQLFLIKRKRRNNSKTLFLCTFRVVAMFLAFVLTQLRGYKKQQKKFKVCKRWYSLQHTLMRSLDEILWSPNWHPVYLTIIPRAQMGYESIAHEAEARMGYWLRGHEGERNNCFSKIQVVGQKNIKTKHLSQGKARL